MSISPELNTMLIAQVARFIPVFVICNGFMMCCDVCCLAVSSVAGRQSHKTPQISHFASAGFRQIRCSPRYVIRIAHFAHLASPLPEMPIGVSHRCRQRQNCQRSLIVSLGRICTEEPQSALLTEQGIRDHGGRRERTCQSSFTYLASCRHFFSIFLIFFLMADGQWFMHHWSQSVGRKQIDRWQIGVAGMVDRCSWNTFQPSALIPYLMARDSSHLLTLTLQE